MNVTLIRRDLIFTAFKMRFVHISNNGHFLKLYLLTTLGSVTNKCDMKL